MMGISRCLGSDVHFGAHARMHVPDVLTSAVALT